MAVAGPNSAFRPAFARATALAEMRPVHEAFRWLHLHQLQMMRWQEELVRIPAPPFGEERRSAWMAERFREAGLAGVRTDGVGNVFGTLGAEAEGLPVILISAHLDTVFPAGVPLTPVVDGDRLEAPGACDNAAGVVGMLALAHALVQSHALAAVVESSGCSVVFCGNVGEEGEGDLRGMRHLYRESPWTKQIAAHLVLDGAGAETVVTQALGSRRYRVTVTGPGGHSFTDAGRPNPILVLALALTALVRDPLEIQESRTTVNVGTIEGGTSVNTIPEQAAATVEFRSTEVRALIGLEVALYRAVEDAVEAANLGRSGGGTGRRGTAKVRYTIETIGDRPAADLPRDSALLEAIRAVDRHLGLRTDLRLGSTDANIPLSLGVPAVSLGAGGEGGGAHTRAEWYSAKGRELGLKRVLLLALTMAEWAAIASHREVGS